MAEQKNLERQRSYILFKDPQYKTLYSALDENDQNTFEQFLENATQEEINQDWLTKPHLSKSQKRQKLTHLAVSKKHDWAFEALQNKGADFLAHDSDGYTPLQKAILGNDIETVKILLPNYTDGYDISTTGLTALHCAAISGNIEIAKLLMSEAPSLDINAQTVDGKTPLHLAAEHGHVAMVNYLMSQDDIKSELFDANGYTPYHAAAAASCETVVEFLLSTGKFHVDSTDANGNTAVALAVLKKEDGMVRYLLNRGAKIQYAEKNALTALGQAVFCGRIGIIQSWIVPEVQGWMSKRSDIDINKPERYGSTLLHLAACQGEVDIARELIRAGANLEATDRSGKTPLQAVKALTVKKQQHKNVIALLENPPKSQQELQKKEALDKVIAGKILAQRQEEEEERLLEEQKERERRQQKQLEQIKEKQEEYLLKEKEKCRQQTEDTANTDEPEGLVAALKQPATELNHATSIVPQKALVKNTTQKNSLNLFNPSIWFFLTLLMIAIGLGSQSLLDFDTAVFSVIDSIALIVVPLLLLISLASVIHYGYTIKNKNLSEETPSVIRKTVLGIGIILGSMLLSGIILAFSIGGLPSELPVLSPLLEFVGNFLQMGLQTFGINSEIVAVGHSFNTALAVGLITSIPLVFILINVERLLTAYFFNDAEKLAIESQPLKSTEQPALISEPEKNSSPTTTTPTFSTSLFHEIPSINSKLKSGDIVIAAHSWIGNNNIDLTIDAGDILQVISIDYKIWPVFPLVRNTRQKEGEVPLMLIEKASQDLITEDLRKKFVTTEHQELPDNHPQPRIEKASQDLTTDLHEKFITTEHQELPVAPQPGMVLKVKQDWQGKQSGDLTIITIKKGETVTFIKANCCLWIEVKNELGEIGYVPSGTLDGLPKEYNLMPDDSYGVMTPQKTSDLLAIGSIVFAMEDWTAEQPEDLTIKKDEKLEVVNNCEVGFPKVKNANGAIGYVPLTSLTETEPQNSLKP